MMADEVCSSTRKRDPYRGKLKAVIFDWAGTVVDFGSMAPVRAMQKLFAAHGFEITVEEARLHMGLLKKDHVRELLSIPRISALWTEWHGHAPTETDAEDMFTEFILHQIRALTENSRLIPGVAEVVKRLRARGLKIGSTTGYTRPIMEQLVPRAAAQGYRPDCIVTSEDVGGGRPSPWMCYQNAIRLKVCPLEAMVKMGDTVTDILEGLNAGMWTAGVVSTGNLIGMTEEDWARLDQATRAKRLDAGRQVMLEAGAHFVTDSIADCEPVLDEIDRRLELGERP